MRDNRDNLNGARRNTNYYRTKAMEFIGEECTEHVCQKELALAVEKIRSKGYRTLDELESCDMGLCLEFVTALKLSVLSELGNRKDAILKLVEKTGVEIIDLADRVTAYFIFVPVFFDVIYNENSTTAEEVCSELMGSPVSNAIIDFAYPALKKLDENPSDFPISATDTSSGPFGMTAEEILDFVAKRIADINRIISDSQG